MTSEPDQNSEEMSSNPSPHSDADSDVPLAEDLNELVNTHYADVYHFAFRLAGNQVEAEDVTQQSFLTACRKLHQVNDLNKVRAWLFTIARNTFLKRKQRFDLEVNGFEETVDAIDDSQTFNLEFDEEALKIALEEMPEEYRSTILLYYFEEIGYKEIAAQLEIPIGTVMSRLSRGKKFLRSKLSRSPETPAENDLKL